MRRAKLTVPTPYLTRAAAPGPAWGPGAPRSRALLNLPGLCPVCGAAAARRLTLTAGERRETYRCARDGETTYEMAGAGRRVLVPSPPGPGPARIDALLVGAA